MFLLDTNVVSEMRRPEPSPHVRMWFQSEPRHAYYLSAISLTELAHGAEAHRDPLQRNEIRRWLNEVLRIWFPDRILSVTSEIAEHAGIMIGVRQRAGTPLALADALIAATAAKNRLVLATRNVKDFQDLAVDIYDPWNDKLIHGGHRP